MPEANVKLTRRMRASVSTAIARILRVLVHLASCHIITKYIYCKL